MEAIYDAILLLKSSPNKANFILHQIAQQTPNFAVLLKDMALQFKDRFKPDPYNLASHSEFQRLTKIILVVFNKSVNSTLREEENKIYLVIDDIYKCFVELFSTPNISFANKKVLRSSFQNMVKEMGFQKKRFLEYLDYVTAQNMQVSASLFIYLDILLECQTIPYNEKALIIQESYQVLFYASLYTVNRTIQYYKNSHMELDQPSDISPFVLILKQTESVIQTLCQILTFVLDSDKFKFTTATLANLLLHNDLATYLYKALKLDKQLLNRFQPNKFGLQIISLDNLSVHERKIVNKIKRTSLTIISMILKVTDKSYNVKFAQNIIIKDLFSLSQIIIQELVICSNQNVFKQIQQNQQVGMITTMFELLSEIAAFRDVRPVFQRMNIQYLIRLSLGYLQTQEQELKTIEQDHQSYFQLAFHIIYGKIDPDVKEICLVMDAFSLKRNVAQFISSMCLFMEGYTSILLDICCDLVLLEMKTRESKSLQFRQMFMEKYKLEAEDIFGFINLDNTLLCTIILLIKVDTTIQEEKFRFLLANLQPQHLDDVEMARTYLLLSIEAKFFKSKDIFTQYYSYIQRAIKMNQKYNFLSKIAFYFLQRIPLQIQKHDSSVLILFDKILNDISVELSSSNSLYIFDYLKKIMQLDSLKKKVLNLNWINTCFQKSILCCNRILRQDYLNNELFVSIFMFYSSLVRQGQIIIDNNSGTCYQNFQEEAQTFTDMINTIFSQKLTQTIQKITSQKQQLQQQNQVLCSVCELMLNIFLKNTTMTQKTVNSVKGIILHLLTLDTIGDLQSDLQLNQFKLLYQLINKYPFDLQANQFEVIRVWLNRHLSSQLLEADVNHVCLIMQLLYFFMHGNCFARQKMINFFNQVTVQIEKMFLKYLVDYDKYLEIVGRDSQFNHAIVNLGQLQTSKQKIKKDPITIVRLYNTVLLNPNFKPQSYHLIKHSIRMYIRNRIPFYDLSVHFLAISTIVAKSKNIAVLQCFKTGIQMLEYNALKQQNQEQIPSASRQFFEIVSGIQSPITIIDPYEQLYKIVNEQIRKAPQTPILVLYRLPFEQIEINILQYIKQDQYTYNLVKKLSSIRRVNNQARIIRKITNCFGFGRA